MKQWKNYGMIKISFDIEERKILRDKLINLFQGKLFKENSEKEIERIIFDVFPQLKYNNLYLAKACNLRSIFEFHPIKPDTIKGITKLYHLTNNIDLVKKEGLKGVSYSADGIRYYSNRIYFSINPFSSKSFIEDSCYMNNREEICIEVKDEDIYLDPEYDSKAGMVYIDADRIEVSRILCTGFHS